MTERRLVDEASLNPKSDRPAKDAYVQELSRRGFANVRIIGSPADISAEKDGAIWYFEVKSTRKRDRYFGAATLNEWIQAAKDPRHFYFVIASKNAEAWEFKEYSPEAFIEHSYIPPFKIYFNVSMNSLAPAKSKTSRASTMVRLTPERLNQMDELYRLFKRRDSN